jgi:ethanolamine ammonia-lyase small subunit
LNAELLVIMLGERPGLSSPDSLGIYVTYLPRVGRTDAERNCISNVRPEGLSYEAAAYKLDFLLTGARKLRMTGVQLKDGSDPDPLSTASECEKHRIARPALPAEKMGP